MLDDRILQEIISDSAALTGVEPGGRMEVFREKYMEPIDVVDDSGSHIGTVPRGFAHRVGLRHAVVYAAVYDHQKRMLLQTREGGRLDIAVGGHVQAGEKDMIQALSREFREELGISPYLKLFTHIDTYNRDAPVSQKRPLERNRERRFVFAYVMPPEQMAELVRSFGGREAISEVEAFAWRTEADVRRAVNHGLAADGLASTLPYLFQ